MWGFVLEWCRIEICLKIFGMVGRKQKQMPRPLLLPFLEGKVSPSPTISMAPGPFGKDAGGQGVPWAQEQAKVTQPLTPRHPDPVDAPHQVWHLDSSRPRGSGRDVMRWRRRIDFTSPLHHSRGHVKSGLERVTWEAGGNWEGYDCFHPRSASSPFAWTWWL